MALKVDSTLTPSSLVRPARRVFELSAGKILSLHRTWNPARGTPVFTRAGRYTSRGWTEWTQGFQYGAALLQFDATGDKQFLELGWQGTLQRMATHVSHVGVHDHGFNNISTYGNVWRLILEGRIPFNSGQLQFCELALKVSGAVQAARWTSLPQGGGFIYSFNGPHSLFIDTLRSLRSLSVAHALGHVLMAERDQRINLLDRLIQHAKTTAQYCIYFGKGRDAYDVRGRVAHESAFNVKDGSYRCPNSQQGYSPFTTWTRGLAWAVLGYAEQLEFLQDWSSRNRGEVSAAVLGWMLESAIATADFYLEQTCSDGVPVWDTGAPGLYRMGDFASKPSDPFNRWEPVDSSAAAIAAQGLLRLGSYLIRLKRTREGRRYRWAGLTVARTLMREPYLSTNSRHQGLLLHTVYHRPNGWDHVARGQKIPNGESCLWGDYHLQELALLILREAEGGFPLRFFGPGPLKADSPPV